MLRKLGRTELGLFLAILLLLLLIGRTKLLHDPDTFWHIVVGRQILSTGEMIHTDRFTSTFAGRPWIANQWLGECLLALITGVAGFDGLVVVTATLLAGLYAWIGRRLVHSGLHWLIVTLVLALVLAASSYNLHVRPHIITIVFLGITFAMLCDFEQRRIGLSRLWWLVPLFVLWTNLHGGVLGGIATLIMAVGGWTAVSLLGKESPISEPRQFLGLVALAGACSLSVLINPYGLAVPQAWLTVMQMRLPELVIEHAPLDPWKPEGQMLLLFSVLYIAVLTRVRRFPRVTWLLPLIWLYLAGTRIRHAPLFAVVAALALAELLPHSRWAVWLRNRDLFQEPDPGTTSAVGPSRWLAVLLPSLLFVLAGLMKWASPLPVDDNGWAHPDPAIWPAELLPELKEYERQHPPGAPIFNEQVYGGFLIYNLPGLRIFIDGRCELFGERFLFEYMEAQKHPEVLDRWEDEYGFEAALMRTGSPFDRHLHESQYWEVSRRTPTATFYIRRKRAQE